MRACGPLLGAFALLAAFSTSASGGECDKKKNCYCECQTVPANSKGFGSCAIAERERAWCSISFAGATGSLGPDSMGPAFPTASKVFDLPDHRDKAYEGLVLRARQTLTPPGLQKLRSAPSADDVAAIALLIRSAYVSEPKLSETELQLLDKALAEALGLDRSLKPAGPANAVVQAFGRDKRYEKGTLVVTQGYVRLRVGETVLRLIWRDLLPE